ncbi:hypothetical protein ADIWIN_2949 [Winogradskyella psychrotolerans RS-3]|uniref:Surface-adhesin protein E-like domain-containing protein n=1 Tax=Winogradskyella psychrotolerans RS-3 TaxID=641526 RepID=S7VPD5_9FLAO|nr:surface-adhesin E family protein [Winogradskyella psychrotolerans]EPR72110.1 hypothetical protein ADIWIN_2949 [Winogradskyella psychrotolerans RS-3]
MKYLIILFFAFYLNANSQTSDWKLLNENEEYKLFTRDHSDKAAWYKIEYKKIKVNETIFGNKQKIKKILILHKFDCENKMIGTLAEISYDENGDTIDSNDYGKYADLENVIPDSLGEMILFKFCN